MLVLTGVSKDYHGLRPLRVEALTLGAGDRTALVGLDQPMAETFVNLVTGATLPEHGEIVAFGQSTAAIADSAAWLAVVDRFGIVSARAVLLEALSVEQNLAMSFTLDIEPLSDDVRARVAPLAREVELAEAAWARPAGEVGEADRVRVRLARALALEPDVLVLEHASAGLAAAETAALAASIRAVVSRRGIALVAVTADRDFAAAVATRVLTLEPATGRLVDRRAGLFGRLFP